MANEMDTQPDSGAAVTLIAAWAVVSIPLLWGAWLTLLNALKLFT